ncbi:hypothetical protein SLEP1_g27645 [Rubroshorea leprosula]|uniref:Uncharacterized protein n=1 Tax=Rubroshorea leprosula TaxID=152421 RepID=A0AAV5JXJ9_9ROSI|nr:hypothetical protein SLEP1_g27645 [Rubroshorea leprosula]
MSARRLPRPRIWVLGRDINHHRLGPTNSVKCNKLITIYIENVTHDGSHAVRS